MRKKLKEPPVPAERHDTVRHEIVSALRGHALSAKELSAVVSVSEKDVYEHLEHIHKSMGKKGQRLTIHPAECLKCGFVFKKREKMKKPSRCPVCRSESVLEPLFSLSGTSSTD